jgi:hypothetical protein
MEERSNIETAGRNLLLRSAPPSFPDAVRDPSGIKQRSGNGQGFGFEGYNGTWEAARAGTSPEHLGD